MREALSWPIQGHTHLKSDTQNVHSSHRHSKAVLPLEFHYINVNEKELKGSMLRISFSFFYMLLCSLFLFGEIIFFIVSPNFIFSFPNTVTSPLSSSFIFPKPKAKTQCFSARSMFTPSYPTKLITLIKKLQSVYSLILCSWDHGRKLSWAYEN